MEGTGRSYQAEGGEQHETDDTSALQLQCLWVVGAVSLVIIIVLLSRFLDKIKARRVSQEPGIPALEQEGPDEGAKKSKERTRKIEEGLVSKKVEVHDALFDIARNVDSSFQKVSSAGISKDLEAPSWQEEVRCRPECPICFDEFKPGEIVSWSFKSNCRHVFHHLCIKQWLQRRKECPVCREICLSIDEAMAIPSQDAMKSNLKKIHVAAPYQASRCFYCNEHGIIYPVVTSTERFDTDEYTAIQQRVGQCPSAGELAMVLDQKMMTRTV